MEPQTNQSSTVIEPSVIGELIPGLPFEDYAKSAGMNATGLKDIDQSPAHYFERRFNRVEGKESEALVFGKLFHYAILEPEHFLKHRIIQPNFDMRTKIGKHDHEAWSLDVNKQSIIIPQKWADKLEMMMNKVLTHPVAKKILEKGIRESTLFWNDVQTGELCKMRPDFISEKGHLVDLKTSMDARPKAFIRSIIDYKYYIQASHYCEGARVTKVCSPDQFIFIVCEKDPPYEVAIYPSGDSVFIVGDHYRSKAMHTYAQCRKENKWPGYNPNMKTVNLPDWLMKDGEDE